MRFSRKYLYGAAVPLALAGTVITTTGAAAAVPPPQPKPNVTVHLVEKPASGQRFETKAAQVGPFRILVKVGQYSRWIGSEDFRQVKALDGSYRMEWAPYGAHTGRYLVVYEREQMGRGLVPAFYVPDARLGGYVQATVFRTGLPGPRGYSQLIVTHREGFMGQRIELLVLTAELGGKLDLQPSHLIPGLGYPASQLWRLDAQAQAPLPMGR